MPSRATEETGGITPIVFYSWQADLEPKTTRYTIRDALKTALKEINAEANLDELPRLDSDTKGLPGTPEVASTLFDKIKTASMCVFDVTFVATSTNADGEEKYSPNSNVVLELGFAAAQIGWGRLICVMNTHYGEPKHMIFDLRHRRWPICFQLSPNADRDTARSTSVELSAKLKSAILTGLKAEHRQVVEAARQLSNEARRFIESRRNWWGSSHAPAAISVPDDRLTHRDPIEQRIYDGAREHERACMIGFNQLLEMGAVEYTFGAEYRWTDFGKQILRCLRNP